MCIFHDWEYIGYIKAHRWLGGVIGGVPIEVVVKAKQCKKCGKVVSVE